MASLQNTTINGGLYLGGNTVVNNLDYYFSGVRTGTPFNGFYLSYNPYNTGYISQHTQSYTVIGDIVQVHGAIGFGYNDNGGFGRIEIFGVNLPFTSSEYSSQLGVVNSWFFGFGFSRTAMTSPKMIVYTNSTLLRFIPSGATTSDISGYPTASINMQNFGNGGASQGNLTYDITYKRQ